MAKSWQPQTGRGAVWELFTHLKRPQSLQRRQPAPSPLEVRLCVIRPVWFVVNMNTKVLVTIQHVHPLRPDANWSRGPPVSPIIHHHLLGFADVELEIFGSPELSTPPPPSIIGSTFNRCMALALSRSPASNTHSFLFNRALMLPIIHTACYSKSIVPFLAELYCNPWHSQWERQWPSPAFFQIYPSQWTWRTPSAPPPPPQTTEGWSQWWPVVSWWQTCMLCVWLILVEEGQWNCWL